MIAVEWKKNVAAFAGNFHLGYAPWVQRISVTTAAAVWTEAGRPWYYDSDNWPTGASFYLEVFMYATAGTVRARLHDITDDVAVASSEVSTASATVVRLITSALALTTAHSYRVSFSPDSGAAGKADGAGMIVA